MAQYLKPDVRDRILRAALGEFAAHGFDGATMAGIARAAGISAGNIYRYYDGKEDLLRAVVSDAWVDRFRSLLRRRVRAAEGMEEVPAGESGHSWARAAAGLLEFAIEHRRRTLILLKSAAGEPLGNHRAGIVDELSVAALGHFDVADEDARRPALAFGLREIYRNYVASLVRVLETFDDPDEIRSVVRTYERYHLVGLKAFFER